MGKREKTLKDRSVGCMGENKIVNIKKCKPYKRKSQGFHKSEITCDFCVIRNSTGLSIR